MAKSGRDHGGKRNGAGRPKGSRMRRSDALAERLLASGKCPVDALVRLAERAEADGETAQAIGAWKSILPYVYPKPKAVEFAPDQVVALASDLAGARASASTGGLEMSHMALVERIIREQNAG